MIGGFLALGFHHVGDGIVSVGLGTAAEGGEAIALPTGHPFRLRAVTAPYRYLRVVTAPYRYLRVVTAPYRYLRIARVA